MSVPVFERLWVGSDRTGQSSLLLDAQDLGMMLHAAYRRIYIQYIIKLSPFGSGCGSRVLQYAENFLKRLRRPKSLCKRNVNAQNHFLDRGVRVIKCCKYFDIT
jgi:hypothetical protein